MRNLVYVAALALVGCYSEDKFADDYAAKLCDMIVECGGEPCADATGTTDTTATATGECDFDAKAAKECIDATWECSPETGGFSFPIPADVCLDVCGGGGGTTTEETTSS